MVVVVVVVGRVSKKEGVGNIDEEFYTYSFIKSLTLSARSFASIFSLCSDVVAALYCIKVVNYSIFDGR